MIDESHDTHSMGLGSFGLALTIVLAIAASTALAQIGLSPKFVPVDIRLCNATEATFRSVDIRTRKLGDIAPGACSAFVRVKRGYSTIGFSSYIGTTRYDAWPIDYVGARILGTNGRYTFVIQFNGCGPYAELADEGSHWPPPTLQPTRIGACSTRHEEQPK